MAEVPREKPKIKIRDLVAQLERINVPSSDFTVEPSVHVPPSTSNQTGSVGEHRVETFSSSSELPIESTQIMDIAMDSLCIPTESQIDYPQPDQHNDCASASIRTHVCKECILPFPKDSHHLKNVYLNRTLVRLDSNELDFLAEVKMAEDMTFVPHPVSNDNLFSSIINQYVHFWTQWGYAADRFNMLRIDVKNLYEQVWMRNICSARVSGKCNDGTTVYLEYAYDQTDLNENSMRELTETDDVLRWVISEELPAVAYDLCRLRHRIHDYLLDILNESPIYRSISASEPPQLLSIQGSLPMYHTQLQNLRCASIILFHILRHTHATEQQAHRADEALISQLQEWVLLIVGTMARACRVQDHLFMLFHILRLPSKLLKPLLCLINPPDPQLAWDRVDSVADFLHQPEVELLLALFAACLRPVRERAKFVCSISKDEDRVAKDDSIFWTMVDSGGESDSDVQVSASKGRANTPSSPHSSGLVNMSQFIGPRDLDRILKQLAFHRVFNCLLPNVEGTRKYEAGHMSILAFADRLLDLIESCGAIYSTHLNAPEPQSHLGEWRLLAKRLARLVHSTVKVIGSRIRAGSCDDDPQSFEELQRTWAQYDAFCLRCTKCLLGGCGLPSTHYDAVRLVCWRYLAQMFPFGLVSSQSKLAVFNLILQSLLPNSYHHVSDWFELAHLPSIILPSLRRALLNLGINDLGLEAILDILGQLASAECRPILVGPPPSEETDHSNYQLPEYECQLIQTITSIIFGLSVFHEPQTTEGPVMKSSTLLDSIPIAPHCARRQLVTIVLAHPQICLDLVFSLILAAGDSLSSADTKRYSTSNQSSVFGRVVFDERLNTQELVLKLVAELPLKFLRPTPSQLDHLLAWLIDQPCDNFGHLLARTTLHCLNWEAVCDLETNEPFIPLAMHLELALSLAQLVHKRLLHPSRLEVIIEHPVVHQIFDSTRKSTSSAIRILLTGLGYQSLKQITSSPAPRPSRKTYRQYEDHINHNRRSQSHDPFISSDSNTTISSGPLLMWCVELLLRLHLPGCAAPILQRPADPTEKNKLMQIWQTLISMDASRNPLASFLLLSVHTYLFGLTTSLSADVLLPTLIHTIVSSRQTHLIIPSLSILFHQLTSTTMPIDDPDLTKVLTRLIETHMHGQLIPPPNSLPSILIGSCLDACVQNPFHCQGLILSVVSMLTQPTWSESSNCVFLLENILQVFVWIQHCHIMHCLNVKPNLSKWFRSDAFGEIQRILTGVYTRDKARSQSKWASQLSSMGGMVTSWAWAHSTRFVSDMKGRFLGTADAALNPSSITSDHQTVINTLSNYPNFSNFLMATPTMLMSCWSNQSIVDSHLLDGNYNFPFWLLTILHRMDYDAQSAVSADQLGQTGIWYRLAPIVCHYVDELVTLKRTMSYDDISQPFLSLMERILMEADILFPVVEQPVVHDKTVLLQRVCPCLCQLAIVQSVSLLATCPLDHPVYMAILHLVLSEIFETQAQLSASPIHAGFLMLYCLPWSIFRVPIKNASRPDQKPASTPTEFTENHSLLDILMGSLRKQLVHFGSITDLPQNHTQVLRTIQNVITLLSDMETWLSRTSYLHVNGSASLPSAADQRTVIDSILDIFDWNKHTSQLNRHTQVWSAYRVSVIHPNQPAESVAKTPKPNAVGLGTMSDDGPLKLPYWDLKSLSITSISASLPRTVQEYPRFIEDMCKSLCHHMKVMCDRIEVVQQLQTKFHSALLPNLYRIINVRKSEQVECKSILPSWMAGSKRCLGGAHLSCDFQTSKINDKVNQACEETSFQITSLLDVLLQDMRRLVSISILDDFPVRRDVDLDDWSVIALCLDKAVGQLVRYSHGLNLDPMICLTHASSQLDASSVRSIGLNCLDQLCRNLSGPLLVSSVSKKLVSDLIRQLAEEFLTSLSAGYERVLDLLVALPHLSPVLLPTFHSPVPSQFADYAKVETNPHPLLSVYSRVLDIRARCGPDVALKLLTSIKVSEWFAHDDGYLSFSAQQYTSLIEALLNCVHRTLPVKTTSSKLDSDIHQICMVHLKMALQFRLSDQFIPVCHMLWKDLCSTEKEVLWTCLAEVMESAIDHYSGFPLSIEQLISLLSALSASFAKTPSCNATSTVLHSMLCDELVHVTPQSHVTAILMVLHILVRELGIKLASCVRDNHMTAFHAAPILIEQMANVFGPLLRSLAATAVLQSTTTPTGNENDGALAASSLIEILIRTMVNILQRCEQICPPEINPAWSGLLVDTFVLWLCSAPSCKTPTNNYPSMRRRNSSSPSPPPTPSNLLSLICSIYHLLPEQLPNLMSCLTLSWAVWRPTTACMDAMIGILLQHRASSPCVKLKVTGLVFHLLRSAVWTDGSFSHAYDYQPRVIFPRWDWRGLSWCSDGLRSPNAHVAWVETLTFLVILCCQNLHKSDLTVKMHVCQLSEVLLSTLDFSLINDRFYIQLFSDLLDSDLPIQLVLMPPTSMEGRLFGLLASAAGMCATSKHHSSSLSAQQIYPSTSSTSLYPSLAAELPTVLSNPSVTKRLAYVRKVITLLQCALITQAMPEDFCLESILNHTANKDDFTEPPNQADEARFLTTWVTQPIGSLFQRFLPVNITEGVSSLLTRVSPTDDAPAKNMDNERVLCVLIWLRIGNLLSELEAASAQSAWEYCENKAFNETVQLTNEIMRLVVSPTQSSPAISSASRTPSSLVNHSTTLFVNAINHWLLGDATTAESLSFTPLPPDLIMPRSINAGLSRHLCCSLLACTSTPMNDSCLVAVARILDAAIWSVLNFAPEQLSPVGRLQSVTQLLTIPNEGESPANLSTIFIHSCLREGILLPLIIFADYRLTALQQYPGESIQVDKYQSLLADLLHWLSTVNLRPALNGSMIELHSLLLLMVYAMRCFCLRLLPNMPNCCPSHPAWSSRMGDGQISGSSCQTASNVFRGLAVLGEVKKAALKLIPSITESTGECDKYDFVHFIDCLEALLNSWLGDSYPHERVYVTLGQLAAKSGSADAPQRIASNLLQHISGWTVERAINFICVHSWPNLQPSVRHLISHCLE